MEIDKSRIRKDDLGDVIADFTVGQKISLVGHLFKLLCCSVPLGIAHTCYPEFQVEQVGAYDLWVYQDYSHKIAINAMTIVKLNANNDLLVVNVRRPTEYLVNEIKKLGNVAIIMIPSLGHDSFATFWKDLFPDAKVYCPKAIINELKDYVIIEGSTEEEFLQDSALSGWKIDLFSDKEHIAQVKQQEVWISLDNNKGARYLLAGCVLVTTKPTWNPLSMCFRKCDGSWGPRLNAMVRAFTIKNKNKEKEFYSELTKQIPWNVIAAQHGPPVVDNSSFVLKKVCQQL